MNQSWMDRIFIILVYSFLICVVLAVLYPLYFVLIASFSSPQLVLNGDIWIWPKDLSWRGYEKLFQNKEIMQGYGNTILYTVTGTAINVALTVAAAFPLSRRNLVGRHWISGFMVFTMFFSGGLIPTYLLMKQLGLLNTYWVMVLPGAVSVWNIMLMRTFFQNGLPFELQEAAAIDGCSNLRILWRIVLPLSAPILAVMVLFYSVGHWNAYFNALIYLSDRVKYPLQLILREILVQGETKDMVDVSEGSLSNSVLDVESIKYAIVIVANLPILILYPFLQKYFNKGVMVGALKG
ncbi:carbohydrate ABC transporter permease [Paenibacillus sp. CGMCC 1.16610]|uniref:ABC transporter permease subunit n=1 Tax=Paenibacillus anseongense TaxID=2682845 RepID=A0ABW9UIH8_9BACL|nr:MULTISPECIES: carbohydrate ABC transporter permease [Paenibacillus]MBA2938574.1 carbohydrate ABC transporter permease [Paenibacillus sp. CGMCC 1.16610]MVQ38766.1 ABC transporter permease subunit [Paenibacillus anseongense]